MSGVAESAGGISRSRGELIVSVERISCMCRATRLRPVEAQMSADEGDVMNR